MAGTAGALLIAMPAAYALAQLRIRFVGAFLFGILISQMIPGIVIANALYTAYNDVGLLNSIREVRRRDIDLAHAGMQPLERIGVVGG